MAYTFSYSPADLLHDSDREALECILECKTKGVPKGLRHDKVLPVDLIARGTDPRTGLSLRIFPLPPNTPLQNAPFAATLAGHLHYRGEIMNHVRDNLPLSQWSNEVLLAYFTSNVDPNRNFAKFFEQTRARLYEILCDRAGGQKNEVQEAYLKACLEYKEHTSVLDPQRPVQHQMQFIALLKAQPGHITVRTHAHNQRLLKLAAKHIGILRSKHWDSVDATSRTYLDFLAPPQTQPKKKKKHGPRGKGKGKATAADGDEKENEDNDDTPAPPQDTTAIDPAHRNSRTSIYVNVDRISRCTVNNPLLQGLIAPMPGMACGIQFMLDFGEAFDMAELFAVLPGAEDDEGDGDHEMRYDGDQKMHGDGDWKPPCDGDHEMDDEDEDEDDSNMSYIEKFERRLKMLDLDIMIL
ncbi:uncharacterized protein K460DRAFT_82814 [Cucurbitaria berberidis CBS 394.84]|uniref:Uncharacterized protein n=1 Tax=Cucurbitaria berberidis CBS 394.84 TaxID=1168544 RepID=A0A9P4LBS8_9PLEO|nr:uncharacterized protein K460DRAFT_82814 [Cucurbitaria berberidis CBS 394.84]KAF1848918.1 hypothetical protein K460DRAFT_82814 [Cucurbitaria berberidis CBS 394.84]